MSQNQCEHIRPDGARCQAPLQTGRSFCFFHDPEQQEKRAAARRNGGFMRDQAYRATSRTDDPAAETPRLLDNSTNAARAAQTAGQTRPEAPSHARVLGPSLATMARPGLKQHAFQNAGA